MAYPDMTTPPGRIAALHAIRDRHLGHTGPIQRQRLLCALHELNAVSTFEASRYLDIYYPPARKFELVDEGHDIVTEMREALTESGRRHRIGIYLLNPKPKAGE